MKNTKATKITLENSCLFVSTPHPQMGVVFSVLHTPTGVESENFHAETVGAAFEFAQNVASGKVTFWGEVR